MIFGQYKPRADDAGLCLAVILLSVCALCYAVNVTRYFPTYSVYSVCVLYTACTCGQHNHAVAACWVEL